MSYTINDLLENLINIEENTLEIYSEIQVNLESKFKALNIIIQVIKKEELKHIKYYKDLKQQFKNNSNNEEIDFYLYDRVAKIFFEFKNQNNIPKISDVQELIRYAFEFEKSNIALLIDIQGRLIQKKDDTNKKVYKIINDIIKEEREHEKMFEKLIISKNRLNWFETLHDWSKEYRDVTCDN